MLRYLIAVALTAGTPVAAQMPSLPQEITSTSALESAARAITEASGEKLLIRDLLDKPIVGSGGSEIGTVTNFAVVPGTGMVAAIVETPDGGRLAIPLKAVKVGSAAGSAPLEVPFAASEVRGMSALSSLADTLSQ